MHHSALEAYMRYTAFKCCLQLQLAQLKRGPGEHHAGASTALGRVVQVDPMNPKLKPPGTKRLKPKCDGKLSTSAFKFNSRRYDLDGKYSVFAEVVSGFDVLLEVNALFEPRKLAAAAARAAGGGGGGGGGSGRGLHSSTFQLNLGRF